MATFVGDFEGELDSDSGEESPQQGYHSGKTTLEEIAKICAEEEVEEDEEDALRGVVNDSCSLKVRPTKQKGKRAGKKAKWSEACTDDLVDIICNSEIYQKKLIFTNVKTAKNGGYYEKMIAELKKRCPSRGDDFPYDIGQTREKFRRLYFRIQKSCLNHENRLGDQTFPRRQRVWEVV